MTALGLQGTLFKAVGGGGLGLADSGRRLEGDTEVDRGAVGDTALDTAGVIGLGGEALAFAGGRDDEGVVVNGSGNLAAAET